MDTRARRARTLLLVALLIGQMPRAARALRHRPPAAAPTCIRIDLEHAPPWRLRLVPGIGPVRAGRIVAVLAQDTADGRPLLVRALGERLAARIAATPLVVLEGDG